MANDGGKLVVFDLDETLIHATKTPKEILEDSRYGDFLIYHRPGLERFLIECSKLYSIAIWSSAEDEYVKAIVERMLPTGVGLLFVWGRSECWVKQVRSKDQYSELETKMYQNIKPLKKIGKMGFAMADLLIIDDSPYKVKDNPGNYIIIEAFEGNQEDKQLFKTMKLIKSYFGH